MIKKIVELESKRLSISPPSIDLFSDANTNHRGYYSSNQDTVFINKKRVINSESDYLGFLNTIIHEVRHKYQMAAVNFPNEHIEASKEARAYLYDAKKKYPKRDDPNFREKYEKNALEHDTRLFAKARALFYKDFNWYQLMSLQQAPSAYVKNQILMDFGGDGADGQIAPVGVKEPFYSLFKNKGTLNKELTNNENVNFMDETNSAREAFLQRLHVDVTSISSKNNGFSNDESPSVSSRVKVRVKQTEFDRDDDCTYRENASSIAGGRLQSNKRVVSETQ